MPFPTDADLHEEVEQLPFGEDEDVPAGKRTYVVDPKRLDQAVMVAGVLLVLSVLAHVLF